MFCGSFTTCGELVLILGLLGLSQGAVIALNAVGLTLVYGATRTVNLAHGDVFGLASALVVSVVLSRIELGVAGLPAIVSVLLALGAAVAGGIGLSLVVERVAFRPFRGHPSIVPLIATVAVSFVFFQAASLWRLPYSIPVLLPQEVLLRVILPGLDLAVRVQDVLVLLIAIVLVLLVDRLLYATRSGRAIQAWSHDPEMAQLMGVHRTRALQLVFVIAGALVGVAAWASTLATRQPVTAYGLESGLIALAAAVLGGVGRPRGALFSGLLIGMITAWNDAMRMEEWTPVLALGLLVIVLVLRPEGLGETIGTTNTTVLDDNGLASAASQPRIGTRWIAGGLVLLAVLYPVVDQLFGFRQQTQLVNIFFFVILALGLTITLGFAGVLNLGYSACFAIGAYTTTFLTSSDRRVTAVMPHVDNFVLVLLFSVITAGIFGMFLATVTQRMQVGYVAVVSLACAQIVQRLFLNLRQWTGGRDGLAVIPPPNLFGYEVRPPALRYYMALAAVLVVATICVRLRPSRVGRAWRALGDDRLAAMACAVPAVRARRTAVVLGAMVAGVAGALYASMVSFVDPERASFLVTMLVVGMVVIGGAGNVLGAVLGAITIASIDQVLIPWLGARIADGAEAPGWQWMATFDVRAFNLLAFGLAVYAALYLRTRGHASGNS